MTRDYATQRERVQAFDGIAAGYDAGYETPLGAFIYAQERRAVASLSSPAGGQYVLEVGVGTGRFGRGFVAQRARVGLEPSLGMLRQVRSSQADDWALVRGLAEALPFPEGVFDVVLCVTTLEFLPAPRLALDEMYRVLRPGGRLIIGVLNAWSPWAWERRRRARQTLYAHAHFFSPPELWRLLRPYGRTKWGSAVFWPPWFSKPVPGISQIWERLGGLVLKPWGAFLVAVVVKEE